MQSERIIGLRRLIKLCCWILYILYLFVLFKYLVLDRLHFYGGNRSYNLIPFDSISQYLNNKEKYNNNIWFMNLVGNLIMLMPFGVLLPMLYSELRKLRIFIVLLLGINLSIEIGQYMMGLGSFDVDDVILNASGALAVYLFIWTVLYKTLLRIEAQKPTKQINHNNIQTRGGNR
ncbi:VanZ family protein [Paenibacillus sp. PL2-23]|uniref:VanZ family protein n=1 Tax=Paenibacillus sp. PL2-23 TaxID=2100729 RepID=UPI00349E59D6